MQVSLHLLQDDPVLWFAGGELADFLKKTSYRISVSLAGPAAPPCENGYRISLGLPCPELACGVRPSTDADAFALCLRAAGGFICGSNPRSVLFGIYRLLFRMGWRWPFPGAEIAPAERVWQPADLYCEETEAAHFRHRGIVLEGGNSAENVLEMIRWLPKLGFNSYFLQFKIPYAFFEPWYAHRENPTRAPEPFTLRDALEIKALLERELQKRGLLYHAAGHGWTCEAVGADALDWEQRADARPAPGAEPLLALVDGTRGFFHGVPINTNLCYSSPDAVQRFCDRVVAYLKEHPRVDVLHVWLADGFNNFCECDRCRALRPADQYLRLLNALDARLAQQGLPTRICFLIYYDLLWPPRTETLRTPDRFVMMFAPISRTFEKSYAEVSAVPPVPTYQYNRITLPKDVEGNLSFLRAWQERLHTDSFVMDYPLGRAHYGDPGYCKISRVICRDVQSLDALGLNGYMSCQEQRCAFPTGLPDYLLGRVLWDPSLRYEAVAEEYFSACYGSRWREVEALLEKISDCFDTDYWNAKLPPLQPELARRLERLPPLLGALEALIARALREPAPQTIRFWEQLAFLPAYARLLGEAIQKKEAGDPLGGAQAFAAFQAYLAENEPMLQPVLDVYRVLRLGRGYAKLGGEPV